ncbi:MAG: ferrous iron transport protein B [Methanosarcinaceae archaeon]|nr:ferrous iron transport protein B [Methanosarcinaceae archaeon]
MKLPSINIKKHNCCSSKPCPSGELQKIILVGNPNVGKSSLFNSLSESYAMVSNYPGTSVEISRGKGKIGNREYEIVDTPGMYSLLPVSEEEKVSRDLLFEDKPLVYLHVVDAKNLRRMLPLTLQLLEAGLPVILVLNMMDEAGERGIIIDFEKLSLLLKIPVVPTVSSEGKGIEELRETIKIFRPVEDYESSGALTDYSLEIEEALKEIESRLEEEEGFSKRAMALLLLQQDSQTLEKVKTGDKAEEIKAMSEELRKKSDQPFQYLITLQRQESVNRILDRVVESLPENPEAGKEKNGKEKNTEKAKKPGIFLKQRKKADLTGKKIAFAEKLDSVLTHPVLGIPVLFLVLYFGLYRFVGVFAAGTVVDFLENVVFGETINPWVSTQFSTLVPYPIIQDLFVGEYGIFTQAVTYAIALILPIVGAFFLVFSIIEDTGYLPRLGMLIDSSFKKIGLSGRAVIPMVLGFGCSTMATMVTRTLETRRERLIATILLALAIPCSAQLGIILSILSVTPKGLLIWAGVICLEFAFVGFLAAKLLPGKEPSFFMELPPLRRPRLSNIAIKTYSRMHWYFLEVLPLFVLASVLIWIGRLTGLFGLALKVMEYPAGWIGLPQDTAVVFLFGFFRRDFGAAGLYDMYDTALLSGVQLVVAAVTLTLFMPCIAQFMMTVKERGLKTALAISGFIFPAAFLAGFVVNTVLSVLKVVI